MCAVACRGAWQYRCLGAVCMQLIDVSQRDARYAQHTGVVLHEEQNWRMKQGSMMWRRCLSQVLLCEHQLTPAPV